jgi:L-2,4-diaminobutyrate decarboxylase
MKNTHNHLYSGASPIQVAADLAPLVDFQPEGMPHEKLLSLVRNNLLPHLMRYDKPQFQSMFNTFPSPEAKLGARVALEYNQGVTNWQVSPGGAVLEELCCQALCKLFGLGPSADATFLYSGTYANQQALYMALHRYAEKQGFDLAQEGVVGFKDPNRLAILVSQDAHFSLKHAVRILGLGEKSLVPLPLDENRRIDVHLLQQITQDISASRDIFCIVATAGTTNTGAIDPIESIADICQEIGAWLHVDGAYGYAYKLVPEWADRFRGDNRADSIVWDPHKQLGAPIPNSVLFVRQKCEFERMALYGSYFNRAEDMEPNPGIKSPPSTRPMSALPLVTILRGQGIKKIIDDLRSPLNAIKTLANTLRTQSDIEVLHEPETGILCFRMIPKNQPKHDLDAPQNYLYQRIMSSGERSISITQLDGMSALRLVVVSPHTTYEDLSETIDILRKLINPYRDVVDKLTSSYL